MSDSNVPGSLTDINVSFGTWPFQSFKIETLSERADQLRSQGISQAFTSHLGGVFNADSSDFNFSLIADAETELAIHPVPVINPVFPGWQKHLDECRSRADIRAIKIYPTFHNYRLSDAEFVAPLAEYLRKHDLKLLVAMRLEDERNRYFALNIVGLPVGDVVTFNKEYADVSTVCLNAYLPEIKRISAESPSLGVDTAFAEWFRALEELTSCIDASRIHFGSHTPFLYTKANVLKLMQSTVPDDVKTRIGSLNTARFMGL